MIKVSAHNFRTSFYPHLRNRASSGSRKQREHAEPIKGSGGVAAADLFNVRQSVAPFFLTALKVSLK
jgi:hypothetical protein